MEIPAVCDIEIIGIARRSLLRQFIGRARAAEVVSDYLALPLVRHEHGGLLWRMFALRENFTPSDAAYVALAELLDATLVTCDLRLTRAARQFTDLNVVGVG